MPRDYAKSSRQRSRRRAPARNESGNGKLWLVALLLMGLFAAGLFYLKQQKEHLTSIQAAAEAAQTAADAHKPPAKKTAVQPRFDFYTMLPKAQVQAPSEPDQETANAAPPPTTTQAPQQTSANNPVAVAASPQSVATAAPAVVASTPQPRANPATTEPQSEETVVAPTPQIHANPAASTPSSQVVITPPPTTEAIKPAPSTLATTPQFILQLGIFKEYASADELKAQAVLQGFDVNITPFKHDSTTLYRVWVGPYKTHLDAKQQQKNLLQNQINSTLMKDPTKT